MSLSPNALKLLPDLIFPELIADDRRPGDDDLDEVQVRVLESLRQADHAPRSADDWAEARCVVNITKVMAFREVIVAELENFPCTEVLLAGGHQMLLAVELEEFMVKRHAALAHLREQERMPTFFPLSLN